MIPTDFTTHRRYCREYPEIVAGETILCRVSFDEELRTSPSTVTVSSVTLSSFAGFGLTLSSVTYSTASWVISGSTVASGRAISFSAAGNVAGTRYGVMMTATTSDGQVLKRIARWDCGTSS